MSALVGILLAVVILVVLIYPFVARRRYKPAPGETIARVASSDTLRHLLYREPVTLRNEYEAGNISLDEYEDQIGELRLEAARMMRERSEHRARLLAAEIDLEMEVQRVRRLRSQGDPQDIPDDV